MPIVVTAVGGEGGEGRKGIVGDCVIDTVDVIVVACCLNARLHAYYHHFSFARVDADLSNSILC